jgi:hypothetical protein
MPAGIFARSRARPGPTKNSVYPYILGHFAHPPLRKLAKVKLRCAAETVNYFVKRPDSERRNGNRAGPRAGIIRRGGTATGMAHVSITQMDLPVLGKMEDAADMTGPPTRWPPVVTGQRIVAVLGLV